MSERKGTRGLELWCKRLVKDYPNVQIDNMTTSWRNGIAFCALVHHFRPDLIDISKLNPENIYENNQLAFTIAEKELGIPALLDPEDMVENDIPDRLSILTYLSQFYRHMGHNVKNRVAENEPKTTLYQSEPAKNTPIQFGKTGLDKCAACGSPVYLAQRLIVSHKLYHRQCYRCAMCHGHLNSKTFQIFEGTEFHCDSCKNEKELFKIIKNNDQIGMLAFHDDDSKNLQSIESETLSSENQKKSSILDKINIFENNTDRSIREVGNKLSNISLNDSKHSEQNLVPENETVDNKFFIIDHKNSTPEKLYKSNVNQINFLQTQLSGESLNMDSQSLKCDVASIEIIENTSPHEDSQANNENINEDKDNYSKCIGITFDNSNSIINTSEESCYETTLETEIKNDTHYINSPQAEIIKIRVPPRRRKRVAQEKLTSPNSNISDKTNKTEYPVHLNPFSDDEDEESECTLETSKVSTNPFENSEDEEENDVLLPIQTVPKTENNPNSTPTRRLISANPFWSDGEEPSTDDDEKNKSSNMYSKSPMTNSTLSLPSSTPRRRKAKAPPPPPVLTATPPHTTQLCLRVKITPIDDVKSISSVSSSNSALFDQKSCGKATPIMTTKDFEPTSLETSSNISGQEDLLDRSIDSTGKSRRKGPAPGLPLPERREVKLQMSPEELQIQLDMLETQQLGLERQGVLIEQMIRQKCEGDEPSNVPQEEVEDLVIQLCEIVNEKNDLFRKQTELMYIRRQQRLEIEQANIEHEIRMIHSRPLFNRVDADKLREEQLVARLVDLVRMRDELVQQLDAERRRERLEDIAIAQSIANKRAQRNSDTSSIKSSEVAETHKKSKMKDKMKKQLKKAKNSLMAKKKDENTVEHREVKADKNKEKK